MVGEVGGLGTAVAPRRAPAIQLSVAVVVAAIAAPYRWSISAGSPPAGLTLGADGVLSGTPASGAGASFTAVVTDSANDSVHAPLTLSVVIPVMIGDVNRYGRLHIKVLSIVLGHFNHGVGPGSSEACPAQPVTPGG